ncbi:MAG: hypothetical protein JW940_17005 [Polyangiaceae bacterium]|nr:hypothetical protein [Polyangiaceae bacterium]
MISKARFSLVGLCGLALLALAMLAAGCNRKDEGKCQEALGHTRDALKVENTELARQWRTYSYGQCADATALQALDREIQAKEAEIAKRASDAAAQKKEQQQLVDVFKQWVAQNRTSAEGAGVTVVCESDDDEKLKKSKERFCTRTRGIGGGKYQFEVRYWEAEPQAVRFMFKPSLPVTCEELGGATMVKEWQVPATTGGTVSRKHCSLTAGVLSGMQALVTHAGVASQYVFNEQYLARDAAFAARLRQ